MSASLCLTYWTILGSAERNRSGSCRLHEWDQSDPPIFEFFFSSTCPQGPMDPRGGRGTSADIVPTQRKFGVDPFTRCWDIAQKPPKCENSSLTSIITKISFPPFSARRRPLTPERGEDISETRVRPHAKLGVNRTADSGSPGAEKKEIKFSLL